jgi:hypothetical protein
MGIIVSLSFLSKSLCLLFFFSIFVVVYDHVKINFIMCCSRSQCIITVRATHKNNDLQSEHLIGGSVLTIADLAGAERKKSTGNMVS